MKNSLSKHANGNPRSFLDLFQCILQILELGSRILNTEYMECDKMGIPFHYKDSGKTNTHKENSYLMILLKENSPPTIISYVADLVHKGMIQTRISRPKELNNI